MATTQRHTKRPPGAVATPLATAPLPAPATGDPAAAVTLGARRVAAALADPGAARGRDEWLSVVGDCQSLINILTAVQDTAIAEAARRESVWCEDGTLGQTVHAPGRVALDAADVLAPVIGATHQQAQRRVEQAVRLAARRVPVPADARDLPEASGLGGLHEAMAAGHLDSYRAGVIAFELDVAPADVADAVVAALSDHLGEDSTSLRRRTRVLLSRISSDLVRERARKARANTGLRRWVAEPGVDEWHGTFPSEDAATAWAAIDKLAHDLVAAGTCTNIEQARGKALTDLVTGNATIDVQIVLTVPADTQPTPDTPQPADPEATLAAAEPHAHAPVFSPNGEHSSDHLVGGTTIAQDTSVDGIAVPSDHAGCADDLAAAIAQDTSVDGTRVQSDPAGCADDLVEMPRALQPTRAPGSGPVADTPHPHPPALQDSGGERDHPLPTRGAPPTGSDEDLVEVQGSRPSEPLLVRRSWLRDHLAKQPPRRSANAPRSPHCSCPATHSPEHASTPSDNLTTHAYRPDPRAHRTGPRPRRPLPLPRLLRRRPVLRPRPRTALAGRAHHRNQPAHPLPTTPPHQTTTRLETCAWHQTGSPPGPTPPAGPAPPHHSTP